MNRFQILSLDGGGLKGVFTASLLSFIERTLQIKIADHFDLIAGTSTGGIIALALGAGFTPEEILTFYLSEGPKIFPSKGVIKRMLKGTKHLFIRKYSSETLKIVLQDSKYFDDKLLGISLKRLIIPSFNPSSNEVHIYKTAHHERLRSDYKTPMWQVAMATASAPTYFPVYINDGGTRLIDGGIWANNPAMVALAEALGYLKQNQSDIAMFSIGTTTPTNRIKFFHYSGGILPWGKKAFEFMMHGQQESASNEAFHILGEERYLRINPVIDRDYKMDKIYDELRGLGESEGRKCINTISDMFIEHKAPIFEPIYKI